MSRASYVYLMQMCDEYKIGVSDNPYRRAKQIGYEYGENIAVVHYFKTPYPFRWESFFHWLFSNQSTGNEWFNLSQSDVALILGYPKIMPYHPCQREAVYELVHPYRYDKYGKSLTAADVTIIKSLQGD